MQHNHVTVWAGCLSGCRPRKYFTWKGEATVRCLSCNTAFIKASAGCEYRGGLRLYPPAAMETAKSQAWEELAEAVLWYHGPDPARQQSALGVKPPHPLHTSLLSLSPLWRLALSLHYLPVQTAAVERKSREPGQREAITQKNKRSALKCEGMHGHVVDAVSSYSKIMQQTTLISQQPQLNVLIALSVNAFSWFALITVFKFVISYSSYCSFHTHHLLLSSNIP